MGVIRRQKASAVVGTPGLDFSGAMAFNSLARSSASIGRTLELRQNQANVITSTREAQLISDKAEEGVDLIKTRVERGEIDAAQGLKEIKAFRQTANNDALSLIKNKNLKMQTTVKTQASTIRALARDTAWAENIQLVKAGSDLEANNNSNAVEARSLTSVDALREHLSTKVFPNSEDAKGVIGFGEAVKFEKGSFKDNVKGYIEGRIQHDPGTIAKELNNPEYQVKIFGKAGFSPNEITTFKQRALGAQLGTNRLTNFSLYNEVIDGYEEAMGKPLTTSLELQDFALLLDRNGFMTPELKRTINNMVSYKQNQEGLGGEDAKGVEKDVDAFSNLEDRIKRLGAQKDDTGVLQFKTEEVMEEALLILVDAKKSLERGDITQGKYDGIRIRLITGIRDMAREDPPGTGSFGETAASAIGSMTNFALVMPSIKKFFKRVGGDEYQFAADKIDAHLAPEEFKTDKARKDTRGVLLGDVYEEIAKDRRNGIPITKESVQKNIDKVLKETLTEHKLPNASEDGKISYFDPVTGRRFKLTNGNYEMVA